MDLAQAAQLFITLSLRNEVSQGLKEISGQLADVNTKQTTFGTISGHVAQGLKTGLTTAATLAAGAIGFAGKEAVVGFESLDQLRQVSAQTEAVIRSTGGAAGQTTASIREYANQAEELTGVDDKVVQSGENVLLTFTNIGGDVFPKAMNAALDVSAAMGQDLQSSVVQLGKALNDPIQGITALTRIGVTFSEEQKKVIASLQATGDTAGAQAVILAELNKEFGGSAQTQMQGYRGEVKRIQDKIEDLQMAFAEKLEPVVERVGDKILNILSDPGTERTIEHFAELIDELFSPQNIDKGAGAIKDIFGYIRDLPWGVIKDGLKQSAEGAKAIADAFKSLPPGVQSGLITVLAANKITGGAVKDVLGDIVKLGLSSLKTINATEVTVVAPGMGGGGGGGRTTAGGTVAGGGPTALATTISLAGAAVSILGLAITYGDMKAAVDATSKEVLSHVPQVASQTFAQALQGTTGLTVGLNTQAQDTFTHLLMQSGSGVKEATASFDAFAKDLMAKAETPAERLLAQTALHDLYGAITTQTDALSYPEYAKTLNDDLTSIDRWANLTAENTNQAQQSLHTQAEAQDRLANLPQQMNQYFSDHGTLAGFFSPVSQNTQATAEHTGRAADLSDQAVNALGQIRTNTADTQAATTAAGAAMDKALAGGLSQVDGGLSQLYGGVSQLDLHNTHIGDAAAVQRRGQIAAAESSSTKLTTTNSRLNDISADTGKAATNTGVLARKKWVLNVNAQTHVRIGAYQVAQVIDHYQLLQGGSIAD